ncbi:hypothetical protein RR49_02555 [Microbacterium ginsengisoli]|jgi:hypothetical protein|uniref:Uncharacterized protein n=1 Tax=Microbacterium ginsengisoli TaxID=400772 RepID=A0A0F0LQA5_9MICO|nr:hypothetical protein RR49_02555 [Microbacterium ginsengisoli]
MITIHTTGFPRTRAVSATVPAVMGLAGTGLRTA